MIKRYIIRWLKRDWHNLDSDALPMAVEKEGTINTRQGMNFSLMSADGGYVVQYRKYDDTTLENEYKLHIITSDQDIGERIGQIITLELLRN
jgi:hypothetical protein